MLLHQQQLFSPKESLEIRSYVRELKDRVVTTYFNEKYDKKGGHNLADHISWWESNNKYDWIHSRIFDWTSTLNLPKKLEKLGAEFIVQKYLKGFGFKPHIDHVLGPDKKTLIRNRLYSILIQLSDTSEYEGGELYVNTDIENKINQTQGTVCIFDSGQTHWVNKITKGERWSSTIFIESDSLKKQLL